MAKEYASYAPDAKQILEAFTDGINAYIKTISAPGGAGLTPDFKAAGFGPEPWKPEDVLTRMAGFPMTRNAVTELAHAELVKMIGAKKASSLYDFNPAVELDPAPGLDLSGLSSSLVSNLVGSDVGISSLLCKRPRTISPSNGTAKTGAAITGSFPGSSPRPDARFSRTIHIAPSTSCPRSATSFTSSRRAGT